MLCKFIEEDELLFRGCLCLRGWLILLLELKLDEPIDELMHFLTMVVEVLGGDQPVPFPERSPRFDPRFSGVEMGTEGGAVGSAESFDGWEDRTGGGVLGMDRVSVDEFGGGVEGEIVERGLQVQGVRPAVPSCGQSLGESLYVSLRQVEVRDLLARELRTDELARVLPGLTAGGEDANTQEGLEALRSIVTNIKVLGLGGQGGSDVFGITGHYQFVIKEPDLHGVDIFADCIHGVDYVLRAPFFLVGFEALNECAEAEGIFALHVGDRAAAPAGGFGMELSLCEGRGYEFVGDVEKKTACEAEGNGRHCSEGKFDGEHGDELCPSKKVYIRLEEKLGRA